MFNVAVHSEQSGTHITTHASRTEARAHKADLVGELRRSHQGSLGHVHQLPEDVL